MGRQRSTTKHKTLIYSLRVPSMFKRKEHVKIYNVFLSLSVLWNVFIKMEILTVNNRKRTNLGSEYHHRKTAHLRLRRFISDILYHNDFVEAREGQRGCFSPRRLAELAPIAALFHYKATESTWPCVKICTTGRVTLPQRPKGQPWQGRHCMQGDKR